VITFTYTQICLIRLVPLFVPSTTFVIVQHD